MEPDAEHLTARSLTIVDEAGEPRITLNGGDSGYGSSIVMWTKAGKSLQIQEQPGGHVSLAIDGRGDFRGQITLTGAGLCVKDDQGRYCVTIGAFHPDGFRGITVYKDGQTSTRILPS